MPFSHTDEQEAFATTVADTLGRHCAIADVRAAIAEPDNARVLWERLVALDLPALLVPESLGGLGLSVVELVAVLEAAGRFAAPVPLTTTLGVFTPLVLAAGGDDPRLTDTIERVLGGDSGTAPAAPGRLLLDELPRLSSGRLSGVCQLIPEGPRADLVAIPALDGGSERVVLVVCPAATLPLSTVEAMDPSSPISSVAFDGHDLADAVVYDGDLTDAWPTVWVATAAELVGLASELVDRAVRHATERVQFGRAIGTFEAVKHRLVDAHLAVERARSLTMYAAVLSARATDRAATLRASHRAKAAASEAAAGAARAAVQVHGGLGITVEHDVSLLYLRARQLGSLFGGADDHYALAAAFAPCSAA